LLLTFFYKSKLNDCPHEESQISEKLMNAFQKIRIREKLTRELKKLKKNSFNEMLSLLNCIQKNMEFSENDNVPR